MKRLIQNGLMFGNLFHVASPTLVERYNRALKHLIGKTTTLTDFHVDISGYSPEVGDELGDDHYLNHAGVNRQFILLSTEQKRCPLLNVKFSTSRDILRRFIAANENQLFALTATDAVAGELVNSVFEVATPVQLFDIRQVRVEADTTRGTLRQADQLAELVDRFKSEEDGWFDDALIAEMIETAEKTGDVTRNPVRLKHEVFEQQNFWTAHFGGLYVFQNVEHPALIASGEKPEGVPLDRVFDLTQDNAVAKFLELNGLVEPIIRARGVDGAAILRQKMGFLAISVLADKGMDLSGLSRSDLRRMAARHASELPTEFEGMAAMVRWAESGGKWPRIKSDHPAYFYCLRATNTPNRDLVNMLLAELTPLDFRQLFICHKEAFYQQYRNWPEAKKDHVAAFLAREYAVDKAGARAALFGHEPDMSGRSTSAQDRPKRRETESLVERVGPWGAVSSRSGNRGRR
ncbi:hypothetical protein J4717_10960 [Phaeobacter sp. HS012]|uniref:DUF6638 family protein n=1 Tax=unclassified Phaeobacter TaxID=2621772 RepID=UPI001B35E089|nr:MULTISPECIES: DUF6638 family protein [unclassified Phaeobacter]MBQ4807989.1 hypothetical protein [Phaeobacter sp. HS012]MBQ4882838.1 hypothetical protein [Phaeobacter sp. HS011]